MKIDGISVHRKVTAARIADACERHMSSLDNPGFCILCGCEAEGVEPDARKYTCDACGEKSVYGAEELAIRMSL